MSTYREIQDAVIRRCCDPSQRADVQLAIQFRHSWLWDENDWSFKRAVATVTFTSGSQQAAAPADLQAVLYMSDANGNPVRGVEDVREFFNDANSNTQPATGSPARYTIIDGQIFTDTKGDGTTGVIVYEKTKPALDDDGDTTGLPDGYDLALVHGGKAEMFKLQIVPDLATSFDADFTAAANVLGKNYLREVKETGQQFGAYRPDVWR